MSYIILGGEEEVFSDLGMSFDYRGSVIKDVSTAFTYRTSLTSDKQIPVNFVGSLTKDGTIISEYLLGVAKDNLFSIDNRTSIDKDVVIPIAYLPGISSDAVMVFTSRQILNSDLSVNVERLVKLYKDVSLTYEFLSNVPPSDIVFPINWTGGILIESDGIFPLDYSLYLNSDGISNLDYLGSLVKDNTPVAEYLSSLDSNSSSIVEYLLGVGTDGIINVDWTGGILVTSDGIIPLDYLMYLDSAATLRYGYLLNVPPSDIYVPFSSLTGLNKDAGWQFENLTTLSVSGLSQYENSVIIYEDESSVIEYLSGVSLNGTLNYTSRQSVATDGIIRVAIIRTVNGDIVIPIDWTGAVVINSDAILPIEFANMLLADGIINTEILSGVSKDVDMLFDYIQKHSSELTVRLDWTGEAATLRDVPKKVFVWRDARLLFKRGDKKRTIH